MREQLSVFTGTVTTVEFYDRYAAFGDQYIRVTFAITRQWKGTPQQNQLFTVSNAASCYGHRFQEGGHYLVYAFQQGDHLNAWWCGGVLSKQNPKSAFAAEIRELDALRRNVR